MLVAKELTTHFATDRGSVHAVDGVSFSLDRGQTLGIVGESGSGKSVLARTIMDLTPRIASTTGLLTFDGMDLLRLSADEGKQLWGNDISLVFQDPSTALNPVLNVGQQIIEPLRLHTKLSAAAGRARAIELLGQVGISEAERRLGMYPHQLSGGMRQRICIAIAIACSPKLLIADEPTTALDVTVQRQILDLLSSLQRRDDMAMILITHDLGVAAGRTHRIMVMYAGRVVEMGPTVSLFRDMRHPYTAALLASIPRVEDASNKTLAAISGQPAEVVNPKPGCRFASRCAYAQPRCLREDPPLTPAAEEGHVFACFYPLGTAAASEALAANLRSGLTATGRKVSEGEVSG